MNQKADRAQKAAALSEAEKKLKQMVVDQPERELIVEVVHVGSNTKVRG